MFEENQEVLLKIRGSIIKSPYLQTCDLCFGWIEKDELMGRTEIYDDASDMIEFDFTNCLKCLEAK